MTQESPCEISFTPAGGSAAVLVSRGDELLRVPEFATGQRMHEAEGVLSGWAFFRPLGGALVEIGWEIEAAAPALMEALDGFLAHGTGALAGTLTITGDTERASYAPAVIRESRPGLPLRGDARRSRAFRVTAGLPEIEML